MFHLQFNGEGHLLYFIQLNVCRNLTFLTNYYYRLHLSINPFQRFDFLYMEPYIF